MTRRHVLRRIRHEDEGQLLLLVLCYVVIAALLVTVVVNVSKAYLYRRSLAAAADAAALVAANQPDLDQLYRRGVVQPDLLPLDERQATRAVDDYVAAARLPDRFHQFDVIDIQVNGGAVSVTLAATVRMPFLNLISSTYADGYPVAATATARSPVLPQTLVAAGRT